MDQELLYALGLDPTMPLEELLEKLQDKNLEYLERLDGCSDAAREKELRKIQQQIENAIIVCSTGVSLERKIRQHQKEEPAPAAMAADAATSVQPTQEIGRLNQAIADYQAGHFDEALPVLEEYGKQSHVLACLLAADILQQQNREQEAMPYLGTAAEQGDGTAALLLAKLYLQQESYVSAQRWGRVAMEQHIAQSGRLTFLATQEQDIQPFLDELSWSKGPDRYTQLTLLCDYLAQRTAPREFYERQKTKDETIKDDEMLQTVYTALHNDQRSHQMLVQRVPRYASLCQLWEKGDTIDGREQRFNRGKKMIFIVSTVIDAVILWLAPISEWVLLALLGYPLIHLLTYPVLSIVTGGYMFFSGTKLRTGDPAYLLYVFIWIVTLGVQIVWIIPNNYAPDLDAVSHQVTLIARVIFIVGTAIVNWLRVNDFRQA